MTVNIKKGMCLNETSALITTDFNSHGSAEGGGVHLVIMDQMDPHVEGQRDRPAVCTLTQTEGRGYVQEQLLASLLVTPQAAR